MTTKINGKHINDCTWLRNKGGEKSSAHTVYCIFKLFEYKLLSFIGRTVTRYQFSVVLYQALRGMGIDSSKIKTHSFQIGAASCNN
jgi:hypothetical protein